MKALKDLNLMASNLFGTISDTLDAARVHTKSWADLAENQVQNSLLESDKELADNLAILMNDVDADMVELKGKYLRLDKEKLVAGYARAEK